MKKISFPVLIMLVTFSINSNAQLNYEFSANSRPYIPVSGGITPHLISDYVKWEVEDEGFARVPIGFNFNYDGENYTHANIDVNGFITLKDSLNIFYNYPYYFNHLGYAPLYNKRPIIAALWDDLLLTDTLNLVYKTTGHAPFRIFTVEWKKVKWGYETPAPVLSIELRLFETTNIIEFHYKDEGSLPNANLAFASIGITSSYANRGFISLQSTSSHPEISMLSANNSLSIKPADNQVYRFRPSFVKIPPPIENSIKYTDNSVSFNLQTGGFNSYEYAITHSAIPPASGTKSFNPNITVGSLQPATTYYIYARSSFLGWFNSQWTCDSFTTAVPPIDPPFVADVNGATYPPWIPIDMRQQDFEDTFYQYDPSLGWFGFSDFPGAGDTGFGYYQVDFYDANAWLYTPGIKLNAGKKYQLKFGYMSNWEFNPADPASLEVKFGKANGVAAMTSGTVFKKTDITNSDVLKDTVIEIRPPASGTYYFGFHDLSLFFKGWILVTNISITEQASPVRAPLVLTGKTNNTDNVLTWAINHSANSKTFEVQRSTDGIHFTKIDDANGQTPSSKTHAVLRVSKNAETSVANNTNEKQSKVLDQNRRGISIQQSDDGINFINLNDNTSTGNHKVPQNISYGYTDRNAKGLIYYRLQQAGKNGLVSYSNVVIINNMRAPGIKIYPNPATDVLNITLPLVSGKTMLVVNDAIGREVIRKDPQDSKMTGNYQLDITSLRPGMYFLKFICSSGCENGALKFEKK